MPSIYRTLYRTCTVATFSAPKIKCNHGSSALVANDVRNLVSIKVFFQSGTTELVGKARFLSSQVQDAELKRKIIHEATEFALQSAEMIASTKLLRMCSREDPDVTPETTTQLLLALDSLQLALNALQVTKFTQPRGNIQK